MITIAILLFAASFFAAAVSGAAGFGGALLLLPLLVGSVGVKQAVPLLTIVQIIGNVSRVGFGWAQIHWRPVGLFLAGAVPMSALGAFLFTELPKALVTRTIGAAILLFVILKYFGILRFEFTPGRLMAGGGVVGLLSGVVGSAGPLGATIFLTLGLPPVAYVASEAFTALVMHGIKIVVYGQFLSPDSHFWILAFGMGAAAILGTWFATSMIERMPRKMFQNFVALLLVIIALYMLVWV